MAKEKKVKTNKAIIALKSKSHVVARQGEGPIGDCIVKAFAILENLTIWNDVVQDEIFKVALSNCMEDKQDNLVNLGASIVDSFLTKDFKKVQNFYENIIKAEVKRQKPGSCLIQEILRPVISSIWNMKNWQSFSMILSAAVSLIIDRARKDSEDGGQIKSQSGLLISNYVPNFGDSEISSLFKWTETIDKSVLTLTIAKKAQAYRIITCRYHYNSKVEVLLFGSTEEMITVKFSDLRTRLNAVLQYEFLFMLEKPFTWIEDENIVIPRFDNGDIYLAMFLPLLRANSGFDYAISNLMRTKEHTRRVSLLSPDKSTLAYYVSCRSFGGDVIQHHIAQMAISQSKTITGSLESTKRLVAVRESPVTTYTPPLTPMTFNHDPLEHHKVDVTQRMSQLTGQDISRQLQGQDLLVIDVKDSNSAKIIDMIGEKWSVEDKAYSLSFKSDSCIVYELDGYVNND